MAGFLDWPTLHLRPIRPGSLSMAAPFRAWEAAD